MRVTRENMTRVVEILEEVEQHAQMIYEANDMWQDADVDPDDRAAAREQIDAELGDLTVTIGDLSTFLGGPA